MSHLLDESYLETLSFERCKSWSNFIKTCAAKKDGKEIDLLGIDEIFKNKDEDSIVATEGAKEKNLEDTLEKLPKSVPQSEVKLMLLDEENNDVLYETLPIVESHVRKWKAAGLDRILDTSDGQKIEQYAGNYLRRNNKMLCRKTKLVEPSSKTSHVCSASNSNESEAESLHSVDTARYIRASRKRTLRTASKYSSPMITIKMYRTLPRKRAELRAKYGCNEIKEDQEHRHHMREVLHRRNQVLMSRRERDLSLHSDVRHNFRLCGRQRRKQLRKRRDTSPMHSTSSSSDDDCEYSKNYSNCDKKTVYSCFRNRSYNRVNYNCKRLKVKARSFEHVHEEQPHATLTGS